MKSDTNSARWISKKEMKVYWSDDIILVSLPHLSLVPHICIVDRVNIGSDNGVSPIQHEATI